MFRSLNEIKISIARVKKKKIEFLGTTFWNAVEDFSQVSWVKRTLYVPQMPKYQVPGLSSLRLITLEAQN